MTNELYRHTSDERPRKSSARLPARSSLAHRARPAFQNGTFDTRCCRDIQIVLHAGGALAVLRGRPVRPWLAASIAGDLGDIAWTFAGREELPPGAVGATAVVAGASAALSAGVAAAMDE